MTKQHDSHIHFALSGTDILGLKHHRVFFLNIDIFIVGHHPNHRNTTKIFQHLYPRLEKADISTEFINQYPLDMLPLFRPKQHHRTVNTGEHSSTVYIRHENHICSGMHSHRQVHQITVTKIDLGDTPRSLHHYRIISGSQTVECGMNLFSQFLPPFTAEIFVSIPIADGTSVEHHL